MLEGLWSVTSAHSRVVSDFVVSVVVRREVMCLRAYRNIWHNEKYGECRTCLGEEATQKIPIIRNFDKREDRLGSKWKI